MKFLNEFLFWSHLSFIPLAVSTGIILPPLIALCLVILHRLHTLLFNGCAFSFVQKYSGGIPRNKDFLQFASKRIFGLNLSRIQSKVLDYSLVTITIVFATIRLLI